MSFPRGGGVPIGAPPPNSFPRVVSNTANFGTRYYTQRSAVYATTWEDALMGQVTPTLEKEEPMLDVLLKLYTMSMCTPGGIGSPMPHLIGPPGCGKSSMVKDLATAVGHNLHIINVSRISPLELEGVQMPNKTNTELSMLTATFWTQLEDGDILLLDEFLRGFPEVYNGMLDILTSRRVGGYRLPNVFIIGASNTSVSYDKALEDRLLHLPVPDPRNKKSIRTALAKRFVDTVGMHPNMVSSYEMEIMLQQEVLPMYDVLDKIGAHRSPVAVSQDGHSLRNLIGQVQLRFIDSSSLKDLLIANNNEAKSEKQFEYTILLSAKSLGEDTIAGLNNLKRPAAYKRLTELQRHNLDINLQLIELEQDGIKPTEKEIPDVHDIFDN